MQQHLFWSEKTLLIELDWVTLCEVELVNTARLVNTGVMTTACTPWPPSCPRFNQHPHMAIYTHSPTTASKLSLFLFLRLFRSIQKPPKQPYLHWQHWGHGKRKKMLRIPETFLVLGPSAEMLVMLKSWMQNAYLCNAYLSEIYLSVYLSSPHLCINLHSWASTAQGKINFRF